MVKFLDRLFILIFIVVAGCFVFYATSPSILTIKVYEGIGP